MRLLPLIFFSLFCYVLSAQSLQTNLQTVFTTNQLMGMSVYVFSAENESVYNFGYKNFSQSLPIDNATKFRIASISKSFTALGILKLYDQNLFELDDDVSTYLGYSVRNPNHPTIPITFRMLLSHTSSLQDGNGYTSFLNATFSQNPIPNISSVLQPGGSYYTSNMWRSEIPGTYFTYSNLNFGLLGTLILIFLILHLKHFWVVSRFTDHITSGEETLFEEMKEVFENPFIVLLYCAAMISLAYHLMHGFSSAFQSLGLNHPKYNKMIHYLGVGFSVIIPLIFAMMPVSIYLGWIN